LAPVWDDVNNSLQASDSTNRLHQEKMEKMFNSIMERLPSPSVSNGKDGLETNNKDVSYQTIADVFDSMVKTSTEQLHDKIDNLSELIKTYVTDSILESHDRELEEILYILTSNSVSAEKFAWLESQVKKMAACCLPPDDVQDLINDWQMMRAIHQRKVELETSLLGPASTSAASTSDTPVNSTLTSDTHITSDDPPPIPLRTHSRSLSTHVNVETEAASNRETIVFFTRELTQIVGKIIITMLQNAKYENITVDQDDGGSSKDNHSTDSTKTPDYEVVDYVDTAGTNSDPSPPPPLRMDSKENGKPDDEMEYEILF
jgi:hypothetical protein